MKKALIIVLALTMMIALVACGGSGKTYKATVDGNNGKVTVNVTVKDDAITEIKLTDHEETEGIYEMAVESVIPQIIANNGTAGVDVAAGATVTSNAIIAGVNEALAQAK